MVLKEAMYVVFFNVISPGSSRYVGWVLKQGEGQTVAKVGRDPWTPGDLITHYQSALFTICMYNVVTTLIVGYVVRELVQIVFTCDVMFV